MRIEMLPSWMEELEEEDMAFIKNFVMTSGSLKEMASKYGVSYPTVRLRLDRLIEKIKVHEDQEADDYIKMVKKLALDDRIDFETAKLLINAFILNNPYGVYYAHISCEIVNGSIVIFIFFNNC